jgi:hypothetical protein
MSIVLLLYFFAAAFLLTSLLVLFFLSKSRQAKGWYLFFIISSTAWLWFLVSKPQAVNGLLLFILPLFWLAGSLKVSSPLTSGSTTPHTPNGEPRVTQEQLKGRSGTLEALRLYFLLLAVGLVLLIAFGVGIVRFY